jgi:macrolide transport system ATP-binding/permease protein
MSLIRLENVSFSYKTAGGHATPILKSVNLEIQAGEMVAIQGPSGSGKSTLLYIIGCLLKSYSGKVEIDGTDIQKLNDGQLAVLRNRHIGFVFQQFHLLPKADVMQNILLPSHYPAERPSLKGAKARAARLVEELGLEGRTHHLPNQLSGGQQQRVSIARALLNDTQIILADEPTGSLDTQNSRQIMELLKAANRSGRTVIVITHDPEVAGQCGRAIQIRDGEVKEITGGSGGDAVQGAKGEILAAIGQHKIEAPKSRWDLWTRYFHMGVALFPMARQSLRQNRSRSALTMLGIVIGVAAVLSMVTIGTFTKRKILESYAEMGVNTLMFHSWINWDLKATDAVPVVFNGFDWANDLVPLKRVFPEILGLSPVLNSWGSKATFGGKVVDDDVAVMGVSPDAFVMAGREMALGNNMSPFHLEYRSPVCVVGFEVFQRLFSNVQPIGQILYINQHENSYACRVIGVLASQSSNKDVNKLNLQIYVPYTFFQAISGDAWQSRIRKVMIQVRQGTDIELFSKKLEAFYKMRYGNSGRFDVGSDSRLVAQMNKFLSLFTVLLGVIAMVSLGVGGIGITNMMLVSVSERFKEIGIRKAFGATNFSIRVQYLVESVLICGIAGVIGLGMGFVLYQSAIYGATKVVAKLTYEWTVDVPALLLSVISIFAVGILSGLTPALRAEKLQVIEALRSE